MNRIVILLITLALFSCKTEKKEVNTTKFVNLNSNETGVKFANNILENDTLNYFKFPYMYMGGGVSVGDINNDGLADLYFTGNMTPNKLYLNKGNMQFEDISEKSGTIGDSRWYTGTTMADVNNDGLLDIYVCTSGKFGPSSNQLFVNNGDNTFTEKAQEYGIADATASIQATFFDYNNDGLVDLFVGNYPLVPVSQGNLFYHIKMLDKFHHESGHLYKNNGDETFTDVTEEAGVTNFGLTLGVVASDLNNDGYQDLFVSNDFNVPDFLYMNNGDGTFTESVKEATTQFSMFGMGSDAADFNNDGLIDLVQMEMTPTTHKRSKTNMASMNPEGFYEGVDFGFHYQYMQNSLQVNTGIYNNMPMFSNIARKAGVHATDWSWGALFADFDNDGLKDMIVTNGMMRDVNNNDVNDQFAAEAFFGDTSNLDYMKYPSTPLDNYMFKNNGDYTFSRANDEWNIKYEGFSNGATYADLDNDGDLDVVLNNLGDVASVFENKSEGLNNYATIKLKGSDKNPLALGAKVTLKTGDVEQTQELTLTRGFQSSVEPELHFGLNKASTIDKIEVLWPNGNVEIVENAQVNKEIVFDLKNANTPKVKNELPKHFEDVTVSLGVNFKHEENKYNDFAYEPLLPHKNSQFGASVSVGDVNGDGLDDFFVGNATGSSGAMYIQNTEGKFDILNGPWEQDAEYEDMEVLLFDFDNDKDLDLYVVSGGNEKKKDAKYFEDRIYLNTPNGFVKGTNVLPKNTTSGLAITAGDFDNDGLTDLFVGGRIIPGKYPFPAKSSLLRNNGGKDLELKFSDVTSEQAPSLNEAGLITSALWEDFNNDGNLDLIIAGEWTPIRFFENKNGSFNEVTESLGFDKNKGWWYSLDKADIDGDGDMDLLAGNLGLNYKYKASDKVPFEVFANDFDENNTMDVVLSYKKKGTQLPLRGRECSSQQVPAIKVRFETYEAYANADLEEIYGEKMLEKSLHYKVNTFANYWIENKGNGMYVMHKLPVEAQLAAINKFQIFDYNGDDYLDIILAGNLYSSEVETPRGDAGVGLVLTGSESKEFDVVAPQESNLFVRGDVRGLEKLKNNKSGKDIYLFSINNEKLKLIQFSK